MDARGLFGHEQLGADLAVGRPSGDELEYLGLRLDPGDNARNADVISSADSRVSVQVIPTDEEKMIAQIVSGLLQKVNQL